jgi:hypothetical protein
VSVRLGRILAAVLAVELASGATSCVADTQPVGVRLVADSQIEVYYRHCLVDRDADLGIYETDVANPGPPALVWQGAVPVDSEPFGVRIQLTPGKSYTMRVLSRDDEVVNTFTNVSSDLPDQRVSYLHLGSMIDSSVAAWSSAAGNWCLNRQLPFVIGGGLGVLLLVVVVAGIVIAIVSRRRRRQLQRSFVGAKPPRTMTKELAKERRRPPPTT